MSARNRTDKELIDGYRLGCLADFELLVSRYQEQIYNYVFSLVRDRQLSDDIFQDTFVKIIRVIKAGVYKDEGKFIQFAMRIAHNLVIDHFRKENRIPVVESSSEDYNYVDNAPITDPSVEQGMIKDQVHSDLRKMIEMLPLEQKEDWHIFALCELSRWQCASACRSESSRRCCRRSPSWHICSPTRERPTRHLKNNLKKPRRLHRRNTSVPLVVMVIVNIKYQ